MQMQADNNQPFVRNSQDRFGPMQPVYRFLIVIHQNAMLLFKCFLFLFYHRFERIFLSFLWSILMNAALKKFPSNLRVVREGPNSFQEISYAGKPQVVSRYILSNLRWWQCSEKKIKSIYKFFQFFEENERKSWRRRWLTLSFE